MGLALWEQGMYPQAEEFAMKSLKIRKSCLPARHFHVAFCEPSCTAVPYLIARNDEIHLSTAEWLLGAIYTDWGRYEDAGCHLAEALTIVNSTCETYVTLYSTDNSPSNPVSSLYN